MSTTETYGNIITYGRKVPDAKDYCNGDLFIKDNGVFYVCHKCKWVKIPPCFDVANLFTGHYPCDLPCNPNKGDVFFSIKG